MEMVGLVLAFPAVLVANVTYAAVAGLLFSKLRRLRQWLLWISWLALALLASDIALVATIGSISSRQTLGDVYWPMHLLGVFLGAPALANVLILPGGRAWYRRWYFAAAICYILGMFLVFFQVGVGDALFGPDGVGGPFSHNLAPDNPQSLTGTATRSRAPRARVSGVAVPQVSVSALSGFGERR